MKAGDIFILCRNNLCITADTNLSMSFYIELTSLDNTMDIHIQTDLFNN